MALTQRTHAMIETHFSNAEKNLAIDATCGNGFDTLFLRGLGFDQVFAFDIQATALQTTMAKLSSKDLAHVKLIQDSHASMAKHVQQSVDCVMFNLGYLPGASKHLTTQAESTIQALETACELLTATGLITVMCYPGHPNGMLENQKVNAWFESMRSGWLIETHLASAPKPTAPVMYSLQRKP